MKIGIVQFRSEKGKVQENINKHLRMIESAVKSNADLVIFPELSITAYEPELAKKHATEVGDNIFNPFQDVSNISRITIGIGIPIKTTNGINISMLIFQPNKERLVYTKRLLHTDELPYFVSGSSQPFLEIKGKKIALGICYETLQREHFIIARAHNADIFIASVAKPDRGTDKAYLHFPSTAKEFQTPILMSNSVGYCDNFLGNGLSAVWNDNGELLGQLNNSTEGLLIYDTDTNSVKIDQPNIVKGQL